MTVAEGGAAAPLPDLHGTEDGTMPMLLTKTSASPGAAARDAFLDAATAALAAALGKPERYVMVALEAGLAMRLGGDAAPAAFLELRSIGLPESRTGELTALLCGLAERHLGVLPARCFVTFEDVARSHWGWDGRTF